MPEKTSPQPEEKEQIKLEHFKVYGNIVTVLITVALGTFGVALINNSFQQRQLEQQRLINAAQLELQQKQADADRRQAEMKYLGEYLENALQDDVSKRLRFAEYFAILTLSPDLQERWKAYQSDMQAALAQQQQLNSELSKAAEAQDHQKQQDLQNQLHLLELKLTRLDSESETAAMGMTPQILKPGNDSDPNKLRERGQLFLEMEFLNQLSSQLKEDLREQERKAVRERIMNIKLLLLKGVWDPTWGKFETFRTWIDNGAIEPVPDGFTKPVDYYRFGQEDIP